MIPRCHDCDRKIRARHLGALHAEPHGKRAQLLIYRGYTHLLDQIPAGAERRERKRALAKAFRAGRAEAIS